MIICTEATLAVGEVYDGCRSLVRSEEKLFFASWTLTDTRGATQSSFRLKVLRPVSLGDYINYCHEENALHLVDLKRLQRMNFYEVSVD